MTTTPTTMIGTPPRRRVHASYADAVRTIADHVRAGRPAPFLIAVDSFGQTVAHVHLDDLPAWMIALDLPAPDWDTHVSGDTIYRRAIWSEVVTDPLLFRIACSSTVPVNPNAATVCRDCSDLGLPPCDPGCPR